MGSGKRENAQKPPRPRRDAESGAVPSGPGSAVEASSQVDESAPDHAERDESHEDALVCAGDVPVNGAQQEGAGGHQTSEPTSAEEWSPVARRASLRVWRATLRVACASSMTR